MKVLSLDQPYATAVALGLKRFETRSWATKYRGPLAIHATDRKPKPMSDFVGLYLDSHEPLPRGVIVATCQLTACELMTPELIAWALGGQERTLALELELGIWKPGRYAFALSDVARVEPGISAKGRQRIWNFAWPIETHA